MHLIHTWFLNVISVIRHLKDHVNLEDMFELYMKTGDLNVEFVTHYLQDSTKHEKLHAKVIINNNIG